MSDSFSFDIGLDNSDKTLHSNSKKSGSFSSTHPLEVTTNRRHSRNISIDTPRLPDDDTEDVITTIDQLKLNTMSTMTIPMSATTHRSSNDFSDKNFNRTSSVAINHTNRSNSKNDLASLLSSSVSSNKSGNSMSSMPMTMTKALPANPETTIHEVHSTLFSNSSINSHSGSPTSLDQLDKIVRAESIKHGSISSAKSNSTSVSKASSNLEQQSGGVGGDKLGTNASSINTFNNISSRSSNENSEPDRDALKTPVNQQQSSFMSSIRSLANLRSPGPSSHSRNGSELSINSNSSYSLPTPTRIKNENGEYVEDPENGTIREQKINGTTEIISFRRSKSSKRSNPSTPQDNDRDRSSSVNSNDVLASPLSVKSNPLDYDPRLYIEQKFLDTQYRYASLKRNMEFHQLFKTVPEDDRLLDDFSCALSREILLQGRLYVSEHYFCFNSNLLGWVTGLVLSLDEIKNFEKKTTAGFFPNGIVVETKDSKHSFASFISRDSTLNFLETIWSKSVTLSTKNHEKLRNIEVFESTASNGKKGLSEDDIFTIDEDEDSSADESDKVVDSSESDVKIKKEDSVDVEFEGPSTHKPTDYKFDYDKNKETIIMDGIFKAPLGLLFDIMFSETDLKYHQHINILNDGYNYSEYGEFTNNEEYGNKPTREYEYEKKLNYSIGPKSTKVECTEIIEFLDYNDHIEVTTIARTPNVPSGNAFEVVTRYIYTWAESDQTHLILSYKINWKGSSWVKSIIEKSTLSGQQSVADDIKRELPAFIPENFATATTTSSTSNNDIIISVDRIGEKKESEIESTKELPSKIAEIETSAVSFVEASLNEVFQTLKSCNTNTYLLSFVLLIQIMILWKFNSINSKLNDLEKVLGK